MHPWSQSGHCAARGSRAHHIVDQLADWPRSAVRFIYISELSYALFARARESFELCSHFKSLPPVAARDLSTNVTWRAHRRKVEKAPRRPRPRIGPVLGEGGVKNFHTELNSFPSSEFMYRIRRPSRDSPYGAEFRERPPSGRAQRYLPTLARCLPPPRPHLPTLAQVFPIAAVTYVPGQRDATQQQQSGSQVAPRPLPRRVTRQPFRGAAWLARRRS